MIKVVSSSILLNCRQINILSTWKCNHPSHPKEYRGLLGWDDVGKTSPLSGPVRSFEQDPIEIYGRQDVIMGIEDDNGEEYDFEIDKTNYRKFRKKAESLIGDRTWFTFKVAGVVDSNYAQEEILRMWLMIAIRVRFKEP